MHFVSDVALALSDVGPWAPALFILAYIFATVAFVPGLALSLAAGALFGVVRGTLYVLVGANVGAVLAFAIARRLAHRHVSAWLSRHHQWAAVGDAVRGRGLMVVLLLRLSPVVPYNVLNYALGVTDVRFRDYLIGSAGMLPGTLLYTYSGKVVGDVTRVVAGQSAPKGAAYYTLLVVGLAATALVTIVVTRAARAALAHAHD